MFCGGPHACSAAVRQADIVPGAVLRFEERFRCMKSYPSPYVSGSSVGPNLARLLLSQPRSQLPLASSIRSEEVVMQNS